ncbi:MAG: hypothetical protein EOO38_31505 [Cytophagaceae bacterium]|nr:MAG: hypothetical protein EOO38_31505 [Cytophagaceae bacterium]
MALDDQSTTFWVHYSRQTGRARLHHATCAYCNSGTGMARRPAIPGGPQVWFPHETIDEASGFLAGLPGEDKARCPRCFP